MIGKRLINTGVAAADALVPSENFNTVLYTGTGAAQRIGGYINRGAVFNGSSSYIASAADIGFNDSVSMWFNVEPSGTGTYSLFGRENGGGLEWGGVSLYYDGTDYNLNMQLRSSTGYYLYQAYQNFTLSDGWHHLVFTFDSSSGYTAYIDNSEVTLTTTLSSGTITFPSGTSSIGRVFGNNDPATYFRGKIDQVRIFNKKLSSGEVTTLYGETHASTTKSTTDIFSDNSGVALYQLDGNANDANIPKHYLFVGDGGNNSTSVRINSVDADFTYTRPIGYDEWGGSFDPNNQGFGFSGNVNNITLSESNKKWDKVGSYYHTIWGTNGYSSGKYYFELEFLAADLLFGISRLDTATTIYETKFSDNAITFYSYSSDKRVYSQTTESGGVTLSVNDVIGIAVNFDLGFLEYYRNNVLIDQVLLQGYNGTATNVTYQEATKFQPDLVWLKRRNSTGNPEIYDSVRGEHKVLQTDGTTSEYDYSTTGVTDFDSNGFSVAGAGGNYNISGGTFVAWCFKSGGTAVSNTDGSITSQVSANQDAGFSIAKISNAVTSPNKTIGHGLSQAPELVIMKRTSTTGSWSVYANALGASNTLFLNNTNASTSTTGWNNLAPDSSVVNVNWSTQADDWILYNFHSVDGYSKVGSYTGTGVAGNSIVTGFEPAFVMIKNTSDIGSWIIHDNKRDTENPRTIHLRANTSGAEDSGANEYVSFHSNGFELVGTGQNVNHSDGDTYIYLAIAADPDTTTPTVENSFDVVTYTGDDTTNRPINVDFKPDFIWVKNRSAATNHTLVDSIRGANNLLFSDTTAAALTTNTTLLPSINDSGFTVGYDGTDVTNGANNNYVAWCWKAGDHDDNLPQINTEGGVDSVVSVNAEAGFSICSWTYSSGTNTVGHGLSSAPELIIYKKRDAAQVWLVFTTAIDGSLDYNYLNTDAFSNSSLSAPTSTVFSIDTGHTGDYVGYCFHSVSGYQKIGSFSYSVGYSENVGFEPRFLLMKKTSSTGSWYMIDNKRVSGTNNYGILANSGAAEDTGTDYITFTSTGFTTTYSDSGTYIYLAIK